VGDLIWNWKFSMSSNSELAELLGTLVQFIRDDSKMLRRAILAKYNEGLPADATNESLSPRDLMIVDGLRGVDHEVTIGQLASQIEFGDASLGNSVNPSNRNAISQAINRLIKSHHRKQLIQKRWNTEGDQRQPLISLTEAGQNLAKELKQVDAWVWRRIVQEMRLNDATAVKILTNGVNRCKEHRKIASQAGIYDYMIGGKYWSVADMLAAERTLAKWPGFRHAAHANRLFLQRAVWYLATEKHIEQFLDIGSGYPTTGSTHELLIKTNQNAAVVYVDNDCDVIDISNWVLQREKQETPGLKATAVCGDLKKIEQVFSDPDVVQYVDFSRPTAILLVAVLHFINNGDIYAILDKILGRLAPRSYVVVSHATCDGPATDEISAAREQYLSRVPSEGGPRSKQQINELFRNWKRVRHEELVYAPDWGKEIVPPNTNSRLQWNNANSAECMSFAAIFQKPMSDSAKTLVSPCDQDAIS
jgi:DNA-binding MarR family transcriptional regulator